VTAEPGPNGQSVLGTGKWERVVEVAGSLMQ
jgi:hypothetical protein